MNSLPTNKWIYIENLKRGRMFAASSKKSGKDHVVETCNTSYKNEDKCKWRIHKQDNSEVYYIENKLRGFMFAASSDKEGNDHIVECRPSIDTFKKAVDAGKERDKWKWIIKKVDNNYIIENVANGAMFAASTDKDGTDNFVETRPQSSINTEKKWLWEMLILNE